MWMQWRIVWMFSELYLKLQKNDRWLEAAAHGYEFLTRHGKDEQGRYYFALACDGSPSMVPYSVAAGLQRIAGGVSAVKAEPTPPSWSKFLYVSACGI